MNSLDKFFSLVENTRTTEHILPESSAPETVAGFFDLVEAPVEAPVAPPKPGTKPAPTPTRPPAPTPTRPPSPFRPPKPAVQPRPKNCLLKTQGDQESE